VRTQISLLGGSKSVPRPSRSYALRCGLVPSDLSSRASQQSAISYGHLSSTDIDTLSLVHSRHHADPDSVDSINSFLEEMFLTEGERERLNDLVIRAPNIDELYRVLNRFGQRSLANRDEVRLDFLSLILSHTVNLS
jgi:hypothetical protein